MNRDDVIRMALEAGISTSGHPMNSWSVYPSELEAFADLAFAAGAAHEREECAKVCEAGVHNAEDWDSSYWDQACRSRAVAIRARGETK